MFKGCLKILILILILSLVIVIYNKLFKPKTPEEVEIIDEKPPNSQHEKVNYQYVIELAYNQANFINYVHQLPSSQLEVLVKRMGISNLTSKRAQIGFIDCA